jgi:hypothetical protein
MKIRSLLLGSVAAAGLSTGAYAADLGVLTSLDVCDALGLSGLTISSDTNCLVITGEVKYKFVWGDYRDDAEVDANLLDGEEITFDAGDENLDWNSRVDAWIRFAAWADSDFGPAKAIIKLKAVQEKQVEGISIGSVGSFTSVSTFTATVSVDAGTSTVAVVATSSASFFSPSSDATTIYLTSDGSTTDGFIIDEAYVSIGDTTVIMAGKKGSILNKGDDAPLNYLGLFNSENVDVGVGWGEDVDIGDGGHVIQVVSDLGNGISVGGGLENLDDSTPEEAGTAVGVISYAGDGLSAHVSFAAAGVLDGEVEDWGVHAGFTGTFENFKIVAAGAFAEDDISGSYMNLLASASATFDMFTIAGSVEYAEDDSGASIWGAGGSLSAMVSDGITLNLGGRFLEESDGDHVYQVEAGVVAAVTETLSVSAAVGYAAEDNGGGADLFYGSAGIAWSPGGDYTASLKATANTEDAYKVETEFKKTFQ